MSLSCQHLRWRVVCDSVFRARVLFFFVEFHLSVPPPSPPAKREKQRIAPSPHMSAKRKRSPSPASDDMGASGLPACQTESTSDARGSSSYQSATLLTSSAGHSIGTDSNHGIALITAFSQRQQCAVVPFISHALPEASTIQVSMNAFPC